MFGANEIVGQKFFKDYGNDSLLVTSRFMTLQGEGPFRGSPAFFVRLAKCNLACSFCDTYFDNGERYTFDQLEEEIYKSVTTYFGDFGFVPDYISRREAVLVLTGGEPMLQKNIGPFIRRMKKLFSISQIESNGILLQDIPDETVLVVSPKCLEKDGKPVRYIKPNLAALERANCLKFVMSADLASPYSSVPDWAHEFAGKKEIFISPMNIYNRLPTKVGIGGTIANRSQIDETVSFWEEGLLNREENKRNHEYAAKYCIQHGFTFNLQQHLYASLP